MFFADFRLNFGCVYELIPNVSHLTSKLEQLLVVLFVQLVRDLLFTLAVKHQSVHWIGAHVRVVFWSLLLVLLHLFLCKNWLTFESFHQVFLDFDLNKLSLANASALLDELSNVLLLLLLIDSAYTHCVLLTLVLVLLEADPHLLSLA